MADIRQIADGGARGDRRCGLDVVLDRV